MRAFTGDHRKRAGTLRPDAAIVEITHVRADQFGEERRLACAVDDGGERTRERVEIHSLTQSGGGITGTGNQFQRARPARPNALGIAAGTRDHARAGEVGLHRRLARTPDCP